MTNEQETDLIEMWQARPMLYKITDKSYKIIFVNRLYNQLINKLKSKTGWFAQIDQQQR